MKVSIYIDDEQCDPGPERIYHKISDMEGSGEVTGISAPKGSQYPEIHIRMADGKTYVFPAYHELIRRLREAGI